MIVEPVEVPGICSFCFCFLFFLCSFYWTFSIFFVHHRHRKQRGEVSLTVGSTETLRDVKLQVTIVNSCFCVIKMLFLLTIPMHCQTDEWWESRKSSTARPRKTVTKMKQYNHWETFKTFFSLRGVTSCVTFYRACTLVARVIVVAMRDTRRLHHQNIL